MKEGLSFSIDKKIVEYTGKKQPQALFIPTASSDDLDYWATFQRVYGQQLKCKTEVLLLLKDKPPQPEIKDKIARADLIYVGGGNTLKMMRLWRRLGVDKCLEKAYHKGTVLCGLSAGAICWYDYGHSDSMAYYNSEDWKYIRVKGMGLIPFLACPHYDSATNGIKREADFHEMILKHPEPAIGIDDCCAIAFENSSFKVLTSRKGAGAYKMKRKKGQLLKEAIPIQDQLLPLKQLYL